MPSDSGREFLRKTTEPGDVYVVSSKKSVHWDSNINNIEGYIFHKINENQLYEITQQILTKTGGFNVRKNKGDVYNRNMLKHALRPIDNIYIAINNLSQTREKMFDGIQEYNTKVLYQQYVISSIRREALFLYDLWETNDWVGSMNTKLISIQDDNINLRNIQQVRTILREPFVNDSTNYLIQEDQLLKYYNFLIDENKKLSKLTKTRFPTCSSNHNVNPDIIQMFIRSFE